ncbi:MAG TPA: DarT ssDNA thymidine ADP-ribosyltransferase family protein, partial [Actinomycetes bacterium]
MERSRIQELHYITDMANVGSILARGNLSRRLAGRTLESHVSVASEDVQARRASKRVWVVESSRALHSYANLYVHARNAMLYTLLKQHRGDLTVLSVHSAVLDLDGVIVADRNAASFAQFLPADEGIAALDEDVVLARWWHESLEARQRRMAEVLMPDRVPPAFIRGA